jgi:uncharacterized protein (DUF2147 family)
LKHFISTAFLFVFTYAIHAQVTGLWKTIGDVDGTEKAIVEIYRQDGKIFGKVIKLLPAAKHSTCEHCPGDQKNRPITGMVVLQDLTETPTGATGGRVTDPSNGKTYKCFLKLESPDKLKLRGYFGVPAIGRTQYWYRVK